MQSVIPVIFSAQNVENGSGRAFFGKGVYFILPNAISDQAPVKK